DTGRNGKLLCGRLQLAESLVVDEEEKLILLDRATEGHAILPHAKRRYGRLAREVVVIEVSSVEYGVSEVAESCAVPVVGPGLGNDIDLSARLGAVLCVVQPAVDAILFDRILRNLQTGLRFLRLLLNTARIHTIEGEVVVIAGSAGETDGTLVAASVVLGKRG